MRNNKFEIEKIHSNVKEQIFKFEMHPFKTKAKILKNQKILNDAIKELESFRKTKMLGFNLIAALFGICIYHTIYILKNRQMLSELSLDLAKRHLFRSIGTGIVVGCFVGYNIARDFKVYRIYKRVSNDLNEMNKNFEYYYILNKEQQFDD